MDESAAIDTLLSYVSGTLLRGRQSSITADTPLVSTGLIDSLALVDVLAVLEDVTGLRIPASKVQPRDLDTVRQMLATAMRVGKPRQ